MQMDAYETAKWLRWHSREVRKALLGFQNVLAALVEYEGDDLLLYLAEQLTVVNNVVFVEGDATEVFSAGYAELCRIEGKIVVPNFCGTVGSSLHEAVSWGVFEMPAWLGELAQSDPPDGFFETDDQPTQWRLALETHYPAFSKEWKEAAEDLELSEWYARLKMELVQAMPLAESFVVRPEDGHQHDAEGDASAYESEEVLLTSRFRPPMCKACGEVRMRVTTSGSKGSRTRHLKCPKCAATAKVSRITRAP
jgi:hypothetical protein